MTRAVRSAAPACLAAVSLAGLCVTGTADAIAQTFDAPANAPPSAALEAFSATGFAAMLATADIATELQPQSDATSRALIATVPNGARFVVLFRQCADLAAAAGCAQATISTAIGSSGLAYADLNRFNGVSRVTTSIYDDENGLVIFGRNLFAPGGVGRGNLKFHFGLFFQDLADFGKGRAGDATSVALGRSPMARDKIAGFGAPQAGLDALPAAADVAGLSSVFADMAIRNAASGDLATAFDIDLGPAE